jgi:hypothetical protein
MSEKYHPSNPDDPDRTAHRLYPRRVRGWYQAAAFEFEVWLFRNDENPT